MDSRTKIIIATNNRGKLNELSNLLGDLPISCISLEEAGIDLEVEETEDTYFGNAILKANTLHCVSGLPTLADDSGLEVDALDGRPGVLTARYGGHKATQIDKWNKLLDELRDVPDEKRTARFRCVIALATQGMPTQTVEGVCEGRIARAPVGSGGFGYDPIFYLPEYGCTMAELPEDVKNKISHRARAVNKAKEVIRKMLENGD